MQKRKTLGELKPWGKLLGMTPKEAEAWIEENPKPNPRANWVMIDCLRDCGGAITCDARLNRLNVLVEDGVIVRLVDIG